MDELELLKKKLEAIVDLVGAVPFESGEDYWEENSDDCFQMGIDVGRYNLAQAILGLIEAEE
jgi:hypothetical protein